MGAELTDDEMVAGGISSSPSEDFEISNCEMRDLIELKSCLIKSFFVCIIVILDDIWLIIINCRKKLE